MKPPETAKETASRYALTWLGLGLGYGYGYGYGLGFGFGFGLGLGLGPRVEVRWFAQTLTLT